MFDSLIDAIKNHAIRVYPEECCGLIVGGMYVPLINRHEDPANHFRIEPGDYLSLIGNSKIQAVVHSHTNGRDFPSRGDMAAQMEMEVPWGISLANENGANDPFWFGDQVPIPPLRERVFRHGVTDCYALVRDWYRIHRQIVLPNLPRDWEWWDANENILVDHFREFGFREIGGEKDLKWGDCVIGEIYDFTCRHDAKPPNHCGVYVGGNQILHHLPNRPSRLDMLGPYRKIITHYLRYAG